MAASTKARTRVALALAALLGSAAAQAAPTCYHSYGSIDANKPNKLFLYFPSTDDPTFPAYGGQPTSPAKKFDISLLPNPPAVGTTAQLRDRIYDVVATAYCEFNVQVLPPTTTNPDALVSPPARRNMIAVGSDANGDASGVYFGQAEAVDGGDADVVDHGRVWAGSYGVFCGAPGRPLDGAGNTLERWAMGIGGTTAHEAGHNYGLSHSTTLHAGEDGILNHLMPAGSNTPCADRVGHLRHFSDQDYGILANNVGLTLQSLWNFDFVNPNAATASALQFEVLSLSASLAPVGTWLANSPWNVPSVTGPVGTKTFKGTVYNRFLVTWQTPKAWSSPNMPGSIAGKIRGGEKFHVGTHLAGANIETATTQVIISDATLLDANGNPLPLHPRVPTFDTGALASNGNYTINVANLAAASLVLKNLQVFVLPRPLHIDALMQDANGGFKLFDVNGETVVPWRQFPIAATAVPTLPPGSPDRPGELKLQVGNLLRDGHNVRVKTNADTGDANGRTEVNRAPSGQLMTDPFPGASVMLTGDLIEPGATQWDPTQQKYISADLVTKIFIQVAGQRAKPVDGGIRGLTGAKVVCANLNSRLSVTAVLDTNGGFDCEKSGLVSMHGDRVQVTQLGRVNSTLPAVQLGGLQISKVVCTNLSTRKTGSYVPASSLSAVDCSKASLQTGLEQVLEISQVGTVR